MLFAQPIHRLFQIALGNKFAFRMRNSDRSRAEQRMAAARGEGGRQPLDPDQHSAHRSDRVHAEIGARAVRRHAFRLDKSYQKR